MSNNLQIYYLIVILIAINRQSVMSETMSQNNLEDIRSTEPTAIDSKLDNSDIKDNGAEDVDELTPNKKLKLSNDINDINETVTPIGGRGRPAKEKSAKRLTILEKTTKEGEALLKDLGHKADSDPDSTRRQTRSQTRGTPPAPPPVKKTPQQKPPKKENSSSGTTPKRRGRPPKNSITPNNNISVENTTEVNANKIENNEKNDSIESESQEKVNNNTNNTDGNNVAISEDHKEVQQNTNQNEVEEEKRPSEINNEQRNEFSEITDNNNKPNSISDDTSNSAVETHAIDRKSVV